MAVQDFLVVSLLLFHLIATSHGVTFSSLPNTLFISTSTKQGQGTDSTYKTVKIKLCYTPVSQQDRPWRKTEDNLEKDKTCQHKIIAKPYSPSDNVFTWKVPRDVPTATYFVRVYVCNSEYEIVAYGQTTDARKTTNMFDVQAISGRHLSLDVASICFSVFSVVLLFGFFFLEKRKSKSSQQK